MIFLGAGASAPFGIDTTPKLTEHIKSLLKEKHLNLLNTIEKFHVEIHDESPDFETILAFLQSLSNPSNVSDGYFKAFLKQNKNLVQDYSEIINKMYDVIRINCEAPFLQGHEKYIQPDDLEQIFSLTYDTLLGSILNRQACDLIFSTNYDPSLEIWCQKRNVKCIDGTEPSNNPEIKTILPLDRKLGQLEAFTSSQKNDSIGLVRLHGSIWNYQRKGGFFIKFNRPSDTCIFPDLYSEIRKKGPVLIYPGQEQSLTRSDWDSYYQYFKQKLTGHCLFIGYSFRHAVINNPIIDNLRNGKIEKLGILSPKPGRLVKRLFPEGDTTGGRIRLFQGKFGEEKVFNQLAVNWRYWYPRYSGSSGIIAQAKNWKLKREDGYIN